MARRPRLNYTAELKAELWDQYQRGLSLSEIGRSINRHSSSIYGLLAPTGGICPVIKRRSEHALTLAEREEVSRGLVLGLSVRTIAAGLDRAPSTISREINRNGDEVAPALVASTDFRLAETGWDRLAIWCRSVSARRRWKSAPYLVTGRGI